MGIIFWGGKADMMKWSLKTPYMKRKFIINSIKAGIFIIALIFAAERLYNSQEKFQTTAEAPSSYGILDVGFTSKEKLKEFNYLVQVLEENYPFFKVSERATGQNWGDNINRYKRILRNTKNDGEYLVALNNILGELNDKNTYVLTGDQYKRFYKHYYESRRPILHHERSLIRYEFDGNLSIDDNSNLIFHNGSVLDTKVISDELAYLKIDAMSYYHVEEDLPKIKEFLKDVEDFDKLVIDIRGNEGGFDNYWIKVMELLVKDNIQADYYSFFKRTAKSTMDVFKIDGIKTIDDLDEAILGKFPQEIKEDFKFYKKNTIEISPMEELNFKGKIYILVDNGVFGSAEKFAAFSKDTGFATLVGEATSGGMTFEDVPMVNLTYGGFIVNYSRELTMNSDGRINMEFGTTPDIVVEGVKINQDLILDKCIQAVLND